MLGVGACNTKRTRQQRVLPSDAIRWLSHKQPRSIAHGLNKGEYMSFNFQWQRKHSAHWWHQVKIKAAQENDSINGVICRLIDAWLTGKIILRKKQAQNS